MVDGASGAGRGVSGLGFSWGSRRCMVVAFGTPGCPASCGGGAPSPLSDLSVSPWSGSAPSLTWSWHGGQHMDDLERRPATWTGLGRRKATWTDLGKRPAIVF